MDLKEKIRSIENFPEEGVIFRDITTLLKEGDALREAIDQIQANLDGVDFDLILGPESRGFIFGMPLAYNLKKGFVPVRKKGKLPAEVISKEYALEYGRKLLLCLFQYGTLFSGDASGRRGTGRDFCIWVQHSRTADVSAGVFWNPSLSYYGYRKALHLWGISAPAFCNLRRSACFWPAVCIL